MLKKRSSSTLYIYLVEYIGAAFRLEFAIIIIFSLCYAQTVNFIDNYTV